MKDKLTHFIELYVLPLLESRSNFVVRGVNLSKFDFNDYNGKYYPNIDVYIDEYLSINDRVGLQKLIKDQINQFFPDIFVVLDANIKFNRIKTNIDE